LNTSVYDLPEVIQEFQEIRRQIALVEAPASCLAFKEALLADIDIQVRYLQAFQQGQDQAELGAILESYVHSDSIYQSEKEELFLAIGLADSTWHELKGEPE
jgi:hypothetical protein